VVVSDISTVSVKVSCAVINNNQYPVRLPPDAPTSSVWKRKVSAAVSATQEPKLVAISLLSSRHCYINFVVTRNKW